MEIIEENKVKYSFVYRMDEEDVLYSYFKVIFNGERIENIKIEEVDLDGISITNLTVKYDIEEFFVDISECTPV
ncbi:MAG: hypothetical protein IKA31_04195 [Clostridia bacterium]|nr:hypothetical protein [Clostridia bacterium]